MAARLLQTSAAAGTLRRASRRARPVWSEAARSVCSVAVPRSRLPSLYHQRSATAFFADDAGTSSGAGDARRWDIWNWTRFRRGLRAGRNVGLAFALFGAGYSKGLHDYGADPEGVQREQCRSMLQSIGAVNKAGQLALMDTESAEAQMVARVFPKVLKGARQEVLHLEKKLQAEVEARKAQGKAPTMEQESMTGKLKKAKVQLTNWRDNGFVLLDMNVPNAFVNGLIARMIFIQRGIFSMAVLKPLPSDLGAISAGGLEVAVKRGEYLVEALLFGLVPSAEGESQQYCSVRLTSGAQSGDDVVVKREELQLLVKHEVIRKDEQLAMLLGHELSHVIHDHTEDSVSLAALGAGIQLVVLAVLDPTGLLSFVLEPLLPLVMSWTLTLPASRAHETEADATGLRICARAGYSPAEGPEFFERLLALEKAMGNDGASTAASWVSTHPSTAERVKALRTSQEDAMALYTQALEKAAAEKVAEPLRKIFGWKLGR